MPASKQIQNLQHLEGNFFFKETTNLDLKKPFDFFSFFFKSILDVQVCTSGKNIVKALHYQIGNFLHITPTSDVALESNKQGNISQKEKGCLGSSVG